MIPPVKVLRGGQLETASTAVVPSGGKAWLGIWLLNGFHDWTRCPANGEKPVR